MSWLQGAELGRSRPHRHLGLELRRLPDRLRPHPLDQLQGRHRRRAGDRLAPLRHPLHRALHAAARRTTPRATRRPRCSAPRPTSTASSCCSTAPSTTTSTSRTRSSSSTSWSEAGKSYRARALSRRAGTGRTDRKLLYQMRPADDGVHRQQPVGRTLGPATATAIESGHGGSEDRRTRSAQTGRPATAATTAGARHPAHPEERWFLAGPGRRGLELIRVLRIAREFFHGFRKLHFVGPCVTVFGSARFGEDHRYYAARRARSARRLAEAGFTVMTGGGPGIMEAANRGAKDAGGRSIGCNIELPHGAAPQPLPRRLRRVPLLLRPQGDAGQVLLRLRRPARRLRHPRRGVRDRDPDPDRQDPGLPAGADGGRLLAADPRLPPPAHGARRHHRGRRTSSGCWPPTPPRRRRSASSHAAVTRFGIEKRRGTVAALGARARVRRE